METNAIMKVRFGDSKLTIGHKDKMGSLNELIEIGNQYRLESGREPMRMDKILELKGIQEYTIMLESKNNAEFPKLPKMGTLKKVTKVMKKKRGKNGGTWAHLNIMVRVAIEMNPEFADDVINTFIKGKLLDYRDVAGDDFKILSSAIRMFNPKVEDRSRMGKGLNHIVFRTHYRDMRNDATPEQMKELIDLQKKLAFAIDMGYIRSMDGLINEMLRIYHTKWDNKI